MPRIPSGSSSRSRSRSSSSSSKSNRSKKSRKTVKKSTFRRELKGKKLTKGQITDIIEFQKRSDATATSIRYSPEGYERKREILSILRFDRDKNLAKILTYGQATSEATTASKIEAGLRV